MELTLIRGGKVDLKEVQCAGGVILLGRTMVVLVRPLNGRDEWLLPKGHVRTEEPLIDCAIREALEETGAVCSAQDVEPISVTHLEEKGESKTINWFLLKAVALKTERAEWLPERQVAKRDIGIFPTIVALSRLTHQDQRDVLTQVLGGVLEVAI